MNATIRPPDRLPIAAARAETRRRPGPTHDHAMAERVQALIDDRRRLACELHDSVIQDIVSAGLVIKLCSVEVPAGSPLTAPLERAHHLVARAAEQLRSAIHGMSDGLPGADLELPDLLMQLRPAVAGQRFRLTVRVIGRAVPLTAVARCALFRIANECLFNTALHANARRAIVSLRYGSTALRLEVADDGDGDPDALKRILRGDIPGSGRGYHRGLVDIAGRVAQFGGQLTVDRSALGGVQLTVCLPLTRVCGTEAEPAIGGDDA